MANAGRRLTCEDVLDHVGGPDVIAGPALVDRHVRAVWAKRQEVRPAASQAITAGPGVGDAFPPVRPVAPGTPPRRPANRGWWSSYLPAVGPVWREADGGR